MMENQRLFLLVALALVMLLIWTTWQQDYGPGRATTADTTAQTAEQAAGSAAPQPDTMAAPAGEAPPPPRAGRPSRQTSGRQRYPPAGLKVNGS